MSTGDGTPRIVALLRLAGETGEATLFGRLEAETGALALRPAHFRLLRFPGPDGLRPTELARRIGITKQALNPLLNDLERWGYLERRPGEGDQRARVVQLTPDGRRLLDTIRRLHAEIEADWEREIGPRRYRAMREGLQQIAARHPDASA
jgi:DNA-binding MarR family transcriptional regulator